MRSRSNRHIKQPIVSILLFFFLLWLSFPQESFSYTPEIIDAVNAIADPKVKPTDRQKGIAFKNNQLINIMRLNGNITDDVYQKNQAFFDTINEGFSQESANKNGVNLEKQKKKPGDLPKPGTDTDNIVSRGDSGKSITLEQAKNTRQTYNTLVGEWLDKMGTGDSGDLDYAKILDTDFLVSRSAVDSDAAFKAISDYINNEGGTAYTRGTAANAEYKIRVNANKPKTPEIFTFDEANGYVKEMHELSAHKFDDAKKWDKTFRELLKTNPEPGTQAHLDMEMARGMSHLARAQASKYITRINKINTQFADQYGLKPKILDSPGFLAVDKGGERDPGSELRQDSDKYLGSELQAGQVAALEKQLVLRATDNFVETLMAIAKKEAGAPSIEKSVLMSIVEVYKGFPEEKRGTLIEQAKLSVGDDFSKALAIEFRDSAPEKPSPETIKRRKQINSNLETLSKTKGGRMLAAAMVIEQTKKTLDTADYYLDWLDDKLLGELRKEPAFDEFETKAKKVKTAKTASAKKTMLQQLKTGVAASSIQKLNSKLNGIVQSSATGRGVTGALSVYNLYTELPVYWDAAQKGDWNKLGIELFRRRVPFGGAAENIAKEKYLLAGWDCVTTVLPPLGLPQAIGGITLQMLTGSEDFYWSSQMTGFKDDLFMTAQFKISQVDSHEGIKAGTWHLVSVRYIDAKREKGRKKSTDELEQDDLIKRENLRQWVEDSWHLRDVLFKTVYSADPVLNAIRQMMKHPDISEKARKNLIIVQSSDKELESNFLPGLLQRETILKDWFVANLIVELENRMAAEYAIISGNYEELFANLIAISEKLEIKEELKKEMKDERKSSVLTWLWDRGQDILVGGGSVSDEMTELATIMLRYIDIYEAVLAARDTAEKDASLVGVSNGGLRLLTGVKMLDIKPDTDLKTAKTWALEPNKAKIWASEALLKIKMKFIKNAKLEGSYDQKILKETQQHEVWRRAWTFVYKNREKLKSTALAQAKLANQERDKRLDQFRKHYEGMVALITLHVKQQINDIQTELPIKGAVVTLHAVAAAEEGKEKMPESKVGGKYEKEALPGTYKITVTANGFKTPQGKKEGVLNFTIPIPKKGKSQAVQKLLYLTPNKGELTVKVVDKLSRGPVPGAEVRLSPSPGKYETFQGVNESSGRFLFKELNPRKDYRIEAKALYFNGPVSKENIVLDTTSAATSMPPTVQIELEPMLSDVQVTVQNHIDGAPLAGVFISMDNKSGTTDTSGIVVLEKIRPSVDGDHELSAQLAGYAPVKKSVSVLPAKAGDVIKKTISLRPGGKITVQVMDAETGAVIPTPEIRVSGYKYDNQKLGSNEGQAEFENLDLEAHYIQVTKAGFLSIEKDREVFITAENPEHNITIQLSAGIRLKVYIKDASTEEKKLVSGKVSMDGVEHFASTGAYEFERVTTDKEHTLKAWAECYGEESKTLTFQPSAGMQSLTFALKPSLTLRVEAREKSPGAALLPGSSLISFSGKDVAGPTRVFGNLTGGSYTASVSADGYANGSGSITIDAQENKCSYTLQIQLEKLLASLSVSVSLTGELEEGEIRPEVSISVSGPRSFSGSGLSAGFSGLPKGSYSITALAKGYGSASTSKEINPTTMGQGYSASLILKKDAVVKEEPEIMAEAIKKLIAEGKIDEANQLLEKMEDGGEKIFDGLPEKLQKKLLGEEEPEEPGTTEEEIKKLIAEGKIDKANELLDDLPDGGEKIFDDLPEKLQKKLLGEDETGGPGATEKEPGTDKEKIKKLIAEGKIDKANELLDDLPDGGGKIFDGLPDKLQKKLLAGGELEEPEVIAKEPLEIEAEETDLDEAPGNVAVKGKAYELKTQTIYYENGRLKDQYTYYLNDKKFRIKHGKRKMWCENGKPRGVWNSKHSYYHGKITIWYCSNGNIESIGLYKDGLAHGPQKAYHENGNLRISSTAQNGYSHGKWTEYHTNGQKHVEKNFDRGSLCKSKYRVWNKNGSLHYEATLDSFSSCKGKYFDDNGKVVSEENRKCDFKCEEVRKKIKVPHVYRN